MTFSRRRLHKTEKRTPTTKGTAKGTTKGTAKGTTKGTAKKRRYTKKHFNSNDGMLTYVWGPPLWHFLHTMSFNYPVEPTATQKRVHKQFMKSLQGILPCGKCRVNLYKNYKQLPLTDKDLQNRETFSKYIYELHETVNRMLNKTSGLSYNEVRNRYENFRARCRSTTTSVSSSPSEEEKGCVDPIHGVKSKCVMNIVPLDTHRKTLTVDSKCTL
jgi:hypothetical protein